ncbi:MAG: phosphoglycerate mutase family protein [Defluviitaleaceae bacterium]|nr:phosphoglycerate mutase family protein [Defluviitaleaceae bacterium]
MKIVYMRHSEPQRTLTDDLGLIGFGRELAPLTKDGIALADETAKSPLLKDAQLIISSPLTRALQTAGIVAKNTGLLIEVEFGLIERWIDLSQKLAFDKAQPLWEEYNSHRGIWSGNEERNWENIEMQHKRLKATLDKYLHYNKIIVVAHGELGRRLQPVKLDFCGMFEIDYTDKFEFLPWND